MMGPMLNAMRLQAQRAMAGLAEPKVGLVTSYDPNTYSARVSLQPEGILTGWMPIASLWVGNGWGMFSPPSINEMVSVYFIDEDAEAGIISGRHYNDVDRPLAVPSGEFWLVHVKGSYFKLTNDGKITFSDGNGATIYLDGSGDIFSQAAQWTHTGPVQITGDLIVDQTITGNTDVIGGGKSLKSHVHSGVASGSSDSGPPV